MFVPVLAELRDVRIVITNLRALLLQQTDHIECRTLAHVVDILFVSDAEHQHSAAVHRFSLLVQRLCHFAYYDNRHLAVDLTSKIDEARFVVERAHFPGEIVRIERDAMSTDTRTGRELHEPEWLRGGGIDYLPDVHAKFVTHDRHLVYQTDIHRAESVLQQLDQLRGLGTRDGHECVEARRI